MIHIYTGDGKGKTTAAIGLAARMAGYDKKILFAQFMKGSDTGELKILCADENIEVLRCDRNYGFFRSMTDKDKESIRKNHNENLDRILKDMARYDMIVLDEIFAAMNYDLADKKRVEKIAQDYKGELVMTGRDAEERFLSMADYVSRITKVKHPYDKGVLAREGVEF